MSGLVKTGSLRALAGVGLACLLSGCLTLAPERRRAEFAPLLAVQELSSGVLGYRLVHGRWPLTVPEVELGLAATRVSPDLMGEVRAVELVAQDETGASYRFGFAGGGTTTLRVNLR
jgi:hypothetical protein